MSELHLLFTLATVHFVGLVSPGPDFALVVQSTSHHGRRAGLAIALGLAVGIFLHTLLSLTGVSYLIQQHPILDVAITVAGSSYLLYLGIGALRATWHYFRHTHGYAQTPKASANIGGSRSAFTRGFMTNILNPKALVFFISVLSALVPVTASTSFKFSVIILFFVIAWIWFSALAWVLSTATMQRHMLRIAPYIDALCGVLFTTIGSGILLNLLTR
ncbi:LysE family translocator [Vibrio sp. SM6]|uniref:LysE family translocator n=1 Tax=Vibrio agarilyticus TaxID=2726741 RepID=A0A7X8YI42_9VIBR|nr:LysE family translocator [Vibrio agarilyticus]NLS14783.1 LysE family translocator [Vibrio agarilyticus]